MVGFATITLSLSSVLAEETTAQSSYPLKSENAIPLGDFSKYLSLSLSFVLRVAALRINDLRVNAHGAEDGEHCRGYRNRELGFAVHGWSFLS
jgi:hypothetical protein